ncbi:MAG: PAS domain-containing protein [Alphaproteobacteria bacterium]
MNSKNGFERRPDPAPPSGQYLFEQTGIFIGYWFRLAKKGLIPEKSSINPRAMLSLLPSVIMLETDRNPGNYRIRLFGTGNMQRWGFEATSTNYLDFAAPQQHRIISDNFSRIHAVPCGVVLAGDELYTSGRVVRNEMVLMPVKAAASGYNILLGIISAEADNGHEYGSDILASVFYSISALHYINIGAGVPA